MFSRLLYRFMRAYGILKSDHEIFVELKAPSCEVALVETLRAHDQVGQAYVKSFVHPWLLRIKELEPELRTACLLYGRPVDPVGLLQAAQAHHFARVGKTGKARGISDSPMIDLRTNENKAAKESGRSRGARGSLQRGYDRLKKANPFALLSPESRPKTSRSAMPSIGELSSAGSSSSDESPEAPPAPERPLDLDW